MNHLPKPSFVSICNCASHANVGLYHVQSKMVSVLFILQKLNIYILFAVCIISYINNIIIKQHNCIFYQMEVWLIVIAVVAGPAAYGKVRYNFTYTKITSQSMANMVEQILYVIGLHHFVIHQFFSRTLNLHNQICHQLSGR